MIDPKERDEIINELKPLFEKAKEKGLIFRSRYQDVYFTPQELETEQAKGNFLFHIQNWELINAAVREAELQKYVDHAKWVLLNFQMKTGKII